MAIRFLTLFFVLLSAGCGFVNYEDVSHDPEYARYVGAQYKTISNMQIYRISMDQNYGPLPSIYKIAAPPGFGGPEVLSKSDLPAGTTMEVLAVKRCTDCYLDSEPRIHMAVRLLSNRQFDDFELQVDKTVLSEHTTELLANVPRS